MAKKIYLSTYSLKILDRKTETLLSSFDGKTDFYDFFQKFTLAIFQNVRKTHSFSNKTVLHLTLDEKSENDDSSRVIYGFLSSGIGGDKFKVRAEGELKTTFEADPEKHITFRDLFFYLKIPRNQRFAYLIIQKTRDLGAKNSIEKALTNFLKENHYSEFEAKIYNLINGAVFTRMISQGNLKTIDFIKKKIPATLDDLMGNGENTTKGTFTTSLKAHKSLNNYWKDFINSIYLKSSANSIIELKDYDDSFDEIEFELELNNKIKTYHVSARHRTQPDVEVSKDLDFENNEPTKESLVRVSESLIEELLTIKDYV